MVVAVVGDGLRAYLVARELEREWAREWAEGGRRSRSSSGVI